MPSEPLPPGATPYFTVAEARKVSPLGDETTYPNADIEAARADAEEALESATACNVAFVPRTATETVSGNGTPLLRLSRWRVRAVLSVSRDGEPLDIAGVRIDGRTLVRPSGAWPHGRANLTVVYEHGYSVPPGRIKRAALRLAKHFLVESAINDRVTRAEAGDERMWLAPLAPFGIPEVDAAVRDHQQHDFSLL